MIYHRLDLGQTTCAGQFAKTSTKDLDQRLSRLYESTLIEPNVSLELRQFDGNREHDERVNHQNVSQTQHCCKKPPLTDARMLVTVTLCE
jgi:hypothetical protein